jgi:hypothetical protein
VTSGEDAASPAGRWIAAGPDTQGGALGWDLVAPLALRYGPRRGTAQCGSRRGTAIWVAPVALWAPGSERLSG